LWVYPTRSSPCHESPHPYESCELGIPCRRAVTLVTFFLGAFEERNYALLEDETGGLRTEEAEHTKLIERHAT
jgi:hypothetical protein